jgi:hypothetical protein
MDLVIFSYYCCGSGRDCFAAAQRHELKPAVSVTKLFGVLPLYGDRARTPGPPRFGVPRRSGVPALRTPIRTRARIERRDEASMTTITEMSPAARAYWFLVVAAGCSCVVRSLAGWQVHEESALRLAIYVIAAIIAL